MDKGYYGFTVGDYEFYTRVSQSTIKMEKGYYHVTAIKIIDIVL